jgi:predicted  nucleic acid-binding Zn-ribbon protein
MLGAHNDITELKKSTQEIEALNKFMTDRELKMVELKQEVDTLLKEIGRKPKYKYRQ